MKFLKKKNILAQIESSYEKFSNMNFEQKY